MGRSESYRQRARTTVAITAGMTTAIVILVSGCTSPDRSRALGDSTVPGKTIALQVCSTCHGVTGTSISPAFPNLARQQQEYLVAQLNAFRSHRRSDPTGREYMWGMASPLSDAQIAELAYFYAAQSPVRRRVTDDATVMAGKTIFEQGFAATGVTACIACHGVHAEGNLQFPRLAGQHADYLVKQMKVFRNTDGRPDGTAMKSITHAMTDRTMAEVAAYLEGIPPVK